jgi:predicted nucleic acid-binding protein
LKYLLDTNVLSEIRKPQGSRAVKGVIAAIDEDDLFLSVISIGEIAKGIAKLDTGRKRRELERWLAQTQQNFADRLLAIDGDVAQLWGELTARVAMKGRVLHAADGLVAATALRHGLRLMTRNVSDFEFTGVMVLNPWDED